MNLPEIPLADAQPGDLVFVQSKGFFGFIIRIGQRLQVLGVFRGVLSYVARRRWSELTRLCKWSHVAVLEGFMPQGTQDRGDPRNWIVRQAAAKGIDTAYLDEVGGVGAKRIVIPLSAWVAVDGSPVSRDRVLAFVTSCRAEYGVLTILSIVLNLFTPKLVDIRREGTLICSALAACALWTGGADAAAADVYQISPVGLLLTTLRASAQRAQ